MTDWVCSYGVRNCPECKPNFTNPALGKRQVRAASPKGLNAVKPLRLVRYNSIVPASDRVYLAVRFAQKDEAKKAGARWDAEARRWYYDARDNNPERFDAWRVKTTTTTTTKTTTTVVEETTTTEVIEETVGISFDELLSAIAYGDEVNAKPAPEMVYVGTKLVGQRSAH